MVRQMVRFEVSGELIREALAIPEDAGIYNIVRHDFLPDVFIFYVEHPDLPELREGSKPQEIEPVITADYDKKPSSWVTFDWGLPEDQD